MEKTEISIAETHPKISTHNCLVDSFQPHDFPEIQQISPLKNDGEGKRSGFLLGASSDIFSGGDVMLTFRSFFWVPLAKRVTLDEILYLNWWFQPIGK